MAEIDNMIDLKTAVKITGADKSTLARHAREGTLKAKKLGNSWVVTESELTRWVKECYKPEMYRK